VRRSFKRIVAFGETAAVIAIVTVALVLLVMPLLGLRTYVITGGSMTGTIDKGALIVDRTVPVNSLRIGDIITFRPPGQAAAVTHRIIAVEFQRDGTPVYRTKGDVNPTPDPWLVTLDRPVQAKYVGHVPHVGYAIALLSLRWVRLFLLALPACVIALLLLSSLWKEAGEELHRREATGPSELQEAAGGPGSPGLRET